ncbi:MAG: 30S ribosomal protein S4 [Candidatus Omnitrophota bacterium]
MSRYTAANCRICRRQGIKLFLKGTRCTTDKCAFVKREYSPGQHGKGKGRKKVSDYGLQLREKQKVRNIYGIIERQFRRYFQLASRAKGVTGERLLELLERRLDNVVFRLCFASSRPQARQFVRHGGVLVNGKKVNIPSYSVKVEDVISFRGKDSFQKKVRENIELCKERGVPAWLETDFKGLTGKIQRLPAKEDVAFPIQEQLIVEFYSK